MYFSAESLHIHYSSPGLHGNWKQPQLKISVFTSTAVKTVT